MRQGRGNVELFKSVRLMMAEGKFIQAERALMDLSLQYEGELPIEFFQELFEVRKQLGKEFPFSELHSFFLKLSEKNLNQEIDDLLSWWTFYHPKFESCELYKWKLTLAENKGQIQDLEKQLKLFGLFILKHHYWSHMETFSNYQKRYFKNNYEVIFLALHYQLLTHQFTEVEKTLHHFVEEEVMKSKRLAEVEDDVELIIALLEQNPAKGTLDIWKGFFQILKEKDWKKIDKKKLIECVIYFDSAPIQLMLIRTVNRIASPELAELMARTLKRSEGFDFILVEKYFSHDLKPLFIGKRKTQEEKRDSVIRLEDLKLDKRFAKQSEKEEHIHHDISEEEILIITGLKYQYLTTEQSLELIVSMLQMNFPLAALEIGKKWAKAEISTDERLKFNYLLIHIYHLLKDYRAGLDLALDSLSIATTSHDILAFTYAEADFYFLLGEKNKAKSLYLSILSLVGNYRMTKERLKALDEV